MVIYELGYLNMFPAVQRLHDFPLQPLIVADHRPVEVDQFAVQVVDDIDFRRRLGKQYRCASGKCLRVSVVFRYQGKDVL